MVRRLVEQQQVRTTHGDHSEHNARFLTVLQTRTSPHTEKKKKTRHHSNKKVFGQRTPALQ
jgi:hypothetical protein